MSRPDLADHRERRAEDQFLDHRVQRRAEQQEDEEDDLVLQGLALDLQPVGYESRADDGAGDLLDDAPHDHIDEYESGDEADVKEVALGLVVEPDDELGQGFSGEVKRTTDNSRKICKKQEYSLLEI